MTKTQLKKATVADILQTPEYSDNLQKLLDLLWESRAKARQKAHMNNQGLKAHVIDTLHDDGVWYAKEFIYEYMSVIDKESQRSSAARAYIREVGTSAYITTLNQLQNENKGKKRVRKDKQ